MLPLTTECTVCLEMIPVIAKKIIILIENLNLNESEVWLYQIFHFWWYLSPLCHKLLWLLFIIIIIIISDKRLSVKFLKEELHQSSMYLPDSSLSLQEGGFGVDSGAPTWWSSQPRHRRCASWFFNLLGKKKINMLKLLSFHVPQSRAEYTNKLLTEFDVPKRVALNKQRCGLDFMEEMGLWALRL